MLPGTGLCRIPRVLNTLTTQNALSKQRQ